MAQSRPLPDWSDVQGLVVSPYTHLDRAAYLLFKFEDMDYAQDWLQKLVPNVTTAFRNPHGEYPLVNVNVALTFSGLTKLAPGDDWSDSGFSTAFQEGIDGTDHRRHILGDTGANDSRRWSWGGGCMANSVDLLVLVFADTEERLQRATTSVMPDPRRMPLVAHVPATPRGVMNNREHFGFVDGLSQPIVEGTHDAEIFPDSIHLTALGEVLLGYPNAYGLVPPIPSLPRLPGFGINGTYLVLRQLEQDVKEFDQFFKKCADSDADDADRLAAKVIGRTQDGTPLVPNTSHFDNEFGFADDPYGYGCPIGSHIRRANPRDSFLNSNDPPEETRLANRHRLVRRGRSYGKKWSEDPGGMRGLMFLCLNADIEQQFEFIQQNWMNTEEFNGVAGECDPLIGNRIGDPRCAFTIPAQPSPLRLMNLPQFVTPRGGEYFFLPSISALQALALRPPTRIPEEPTPGGFEEDVAEIKSQLRAEYVPPTVKRDAHPKAHGCVQATLVVDAASVPERLQLGVFAKDAKYQAWVRFSNAFRFQHDLEPEVRGMAVKLLSVTAGEPLPEAEILNERATQDFLFATHDAFFLPNPEEYLEFLQAVRTAPTGVMNFYRRRLRLWRGFIAMFRSQFVLAPNPLAITYYSQTPYRLGREDGRHEIIKLRMVPRSPEARPRLGERLLFWLKARSALVILQAAELMSADGKTSAEAFCERHFADHDFLRHALIRSLGAHEGVFDLEIQRQGTDDPVDDATRPWRATPFEKVATLHIPRQVFYPDPSMPDALVKAASEMVELGENMSFSPWHGLVEHEPLGRINAARRAVYQQISRFRRGLNTVSREKTIDQQVNDYDTIARVVQR